MLCDVFVSISNYCGKQRFSVCIENHWLGNDAIHHHSLSRQYMKTMTKTEKGQNKLRTENMEKWRIFFSKTWESERFNGNEVELYIVEWTGMNRRKTYIIGKEPKLKYHFCSLRIRLKVCVGVVYWCSKHRAHKCNLFSSFFLFHIWRKKKFFSHVSLLFVENITIMVECTYTKIA